VARRDAGLVRGERSAIYCTGHDVGMEGGNLCTDGMEEKDFVSKLGSEKVN